MVSRTLKNWAIGIYVVLMIAVAWLTAVKKYSWWWFISMFLIPLIVFIWYLVNKKKPMPELDKKPKKITTDEAIKYLKEYIKLKNDDLADEIMEILIQPYTPRQEGNEKNSFLKAQIKRYNARDTVFIVMKDDALEVLAYHIYESQSEESMKKYEEDFNKRIDKIVLNPREYIEEIIPVGDGYNKRRVPISFMQREKEREQIKENLAEEGVEKE